MKPGPSVVDVPAFVDVPAVISASPNPVATSQAAHPTLRASDDVNWIAVHVAESVLASSGESREATPDIEQLIRSQAELAELNNPPAELFISSANPSLSYQYKQQQNGDKLVPSVSAEEAFKYHKTGSP